MNRKQNFANQSGAGVYAQMSAYPKYNSRIAPACRQSTPELKPHHSHHWDGGIWSIQKFVDHGHKPGGAGRDVMCPVPGRDRQTRMWISRYSSTACSGRITSASPTITSAGDPVANRVAPDVSEIAHALYTLSKNNCRLSG